MGRGRPTFSKIRQNMIELLFFMGKAYGYEIYKAYKEIFPQVTLRVMYYHLRKGVELEEFRQHKIVVEEGDYSWGRNVERIYYSLSDSAHPRIDPRVKEYFEKIERKHAEK